MKKIRKNTARKLYNMGKSILILPCKCHPGAMWLHGFEIRKTDPKNDFDRLINEFEYYNCNAETGTYTAYYAEEVNA